MIAPMHAPDRLLAAARAGDRAALGPLLQSFRAYLTALAGDALDAGLRAKGGPSDLVQETFLEAYRHFDQFRGESGEEFAGWLRAILQRNNLKMVRHYRGSEKRCSARESPLAGPASSGVGGGPAAPGQSPSADAAGREEEDAFWAAVGRLREEHRRVVLLRYVEERSFEEIAESLGATAAAARGVWFRAVRELRRELGVDDGDAR